MAEQSEFTWEDACGFADRIVFEQTAKHLTDLEVKVLRGAWDKLTYDEMAQLYNYGAGYLNRDIGNPLWKKLSKALGEKVSKVSFSEALRRSRLKRQTAIGQSSGILDADEIDAEETFVEGPVPPQSPFYVRRENVEALGFKSVVKSGSLIRIKAPRLMGKTSLVYTLLAYAEEREYSTVYLDLHSIDTSIVADLERLLRWLCAAVSRRLKLPNRLNDYWDSEIFGSNDNCTAYFEEYLLSQLDRPLVLALDNVDRIFPQREIIDDFFGLLRSWHEKGRIAQIWQNLRLILSHSTEAYIPLDYNQSPFNTGIPIELPEFDRQQIAAIAKLQQLDLDSADIDALQAMVGGHPYLVRLALQESSTKQIPLDRLLQDACAEPGIYSDHLRRLWVALQDNAELLQALETVVNSSDPVSLNPIVTYKLHSMGAIEYRDNRVVPRCNLYRDYFRTLADNR
ncbi:AAA-like domain-containing protein [Synechococcus sp. PCC 7336]|uniref:AAA-like domain-containing protein n=1 Tax=Synechococcus sp. PCC 7336 TaxID=195250 RepID=UPI00034CBE49|nr:AAA-like domain-containing protein [Synechococcus sp. PCC 7336]